MGREREMEGHLMLFQVRGRRRGASGEGEEREGTLSGE